MTMVLFPMIIFMTILYNIIQTNMMRQLFIR